MSAPSTPDLPPDLAAQLAQLRDIHLPDAVSWWPLAPGWWALLASIGLLGAAVVIVLYRRRRSLKHRALKELECLDRGVGAQGSMHQLASDICVLVRRVVINGAQGGRLAGTHGDAWSEFLASPPYGMPMEIARFIASAPYASTDATDPDTATSAPDRETLISVTEHWIRRHA